MKDIILQLIQKVGPVGITEIRSIIGRELSTLLTMKKVWDYVHELEAEGKIEVIQNKNYSYSIRGKNGK